MQTPENVSLEVRAAVMNEFIRVNAARDRSSKGSITRYYADPVAFAHDCFRWPVGQGLTEYQEEVLAAIPVKKKVAVRSLHGAGKTTTDALAVLWFALTRDAAGVDWKCPTTAGAWRQLEQYLWPEIHKWARLVRWDTLGRKPFRTNELLRLNLNLEFGRAFAVASDVPALIEGVHADSVLYLFDESKAISVHTFDAAEGAFSGGAGTEAFALATSTPGEPVGRFYDICRRRPGLTDWHPVHISLERAIAAGRVSAEWAEKRKVQWGESSQLYANRVLGEFQSSDEDGVIPLSWVEAAVRRWEERDFEERPLDALDVVGVDVARQGDDRTVLALRHGTRIHELRYSFHEDTMVTSGRVGGILIANPGAAAVVDTDGLGAGVTDRLRESLGDDTGDMVDGGFNVVAFHAGKRTDRRDRSGELGFTNTRSAAWWHLREALDPANGSTLELPPDDVLIGDLTAPHWKPMSDSRISVERKVDVKKRLGRSTDAADAVVQAFWEERVKKRSRMTHAGRAS
jgi:hypothetical protein